MDSHFSNQQQDRMPVSGTTMGGVNVPRIVRVAVWSVFYFLFYLVQQVSELVAPLVLILGIGWSALPHVIGIVNGAAGNDPQTRDMIAHVAHSIPDHLEVGSHLLTPSSLVFDGLLLMAAAALCATLSTIAARTM
ncbi:hypothetical protein LU298_00915 [Komagataeibacter intermedius]|uniref:Uncharacterized protein n=2 Tax=Komagataeibacter intermedius TaxID=66229 RepID=A0A0N1N5Z4_9PROT|nr:MULTISPECIES: hypothetical protein [Komagataeibacter]KPH88998.1 hypothetical protein GLUCOINTEAF2_0200132 [Komagataeibacter intermedius AF2]MBV0887721.1 hypothetical protein [Komagataeibacter oboediens]MCF3635065.1 hypothetical protein [Komagataeibacter intermedius]MCK9820575.1 hypothetical protein [Komagataeibacter oboediens]GAN87586.1 hypothetical protein Gain_0074_017 [Komagataeibacter intermedius TF2]